MSETAFTICCEPRRIADTAGANVWDLGGPRPVAPDAARSKRVQAGRDALQGWERPTAKLETIERFKSHHRGAVGERLAGIQRLFAAAV